MTNSTLLKQSRSWDRIDPAGLLPLAGVRTTVNRFGYLLRPYWIPATRLEYRIERMSRDGREELSRRIFLEMLRCDADGCTWRERSANSNANDESAPESVLVYNRTRQALYHYGENEENLSVARNRAFERLPLLPPLMPIPVGFRWHVADGDDSLDFHLESVRKVGDMTVLSIRRHGTFTPEGHCHRVERRGITAYALERSVVLEDRTCDTFGDGREFRTVRKLVGSSLPPDRPALAPLYVKYRTENHPYIYDCGTGRILETNDSVYELIDDYRILPPEEIAARHPKKDRDTVWKTMEHLDSLGGEHYLRAHEPTEASPLEIVQYKDEYHKVEEFWAKNGSLLVLGLTERCNLNCSYCCYSGSFPEFRKHGAQVMDFEVAKKAIMHFLDHDLARDGKYPITFYGGEPLLEFPLLCRCVRFAEEYAAERGKQVRFSITTNGTLLSDEVVDFLVEHDFLILTSFDGLKASHDRYRVFPDGTGSFDLVLKKLHRFAERYPDYVKRGINVTLAPPFDLRATARFVDELAARYPIVRTAIVYTGAEHRFSGDADSATRYGCSSCSACESDKLSGNDSFRRFEPEDAAQLKAMWNEAVGVITRYGIAGARERFPFLTALFGSQIAALHDRPVLQRPSEWVFMVPCVPGFTRRFVDVGGNYRVCERVDDSESYILGNVHEGLDPARLKWVLEQRRHFGDCGNCSALKTCDLCYARIPATDNASGGYDDRFESACVQTRRRHADLLPVYTGIMERNPKAFEEAISPEMRLETPFLLRFGSPGSRLDESVHKTLQSETF